MGPAVRGPTHPGNETGEAPGWQGTTRGDWQGCSPEEQRRAAEDVRVAAIFTANQADRGLSAFDETCADCHREFRGHAFQSNWGHRTVYSFYRTIRSTVPDENPGGLADETCLDVVSYILSINGHAAGTAELTADSPMRRVRMTPVAIHP